MKIIERMARGMAQKHACFFAPDDLVSLCIPYTPASMALIARGIHKKLDDGAYMPFWEIFVPEARAAIEAMREPTEAMLEVVTDPILRLGEPTLPRVQQWRDALWRAMIDKALSE